MHFKPRLALSIGLSFAVLMLALATLQHAQPLVAQGALVRGPFAVSAAARMSFDGDVRLLPTVTPTTESEREQGDEPERSNPRLQRTRDPKFATSAARAQPFVATSSMPSPSVSFNGLSQTTFITRNNWPPDPVGDVGPQHYIQAINRSVAIFSKTGELLADFTFQMFFTGSVELDPCYRNGRGDPVVLYDSLADRWLIAEWAHPIGVLGPHYECIAVSKTSDPVAGGWWLYALQTVPEHAHWQNDFNKIGLWPDGYYMTANLYDWDVCCPAFKGVRVWALDRNSLLNGSFSSIYFDIVWDGYCCWSLLPSNLRGAPPPSGSPNYLLDAGTNVTDTVLHLWKFHVDWTNPLSNSTFVGPATITVTPFVELYGNVVPQVGNITNTLNVGDDNLGSQLQYRNIGGIESLWATHMISGALASALRWYELRNPNSAPSVYQQGTFEPDVNYRFMPSLAVDQNGNMALGYSVSGASDLERKFCNELETAYY